MKRISIDPITRLEGHGKIDIFLNEEGDVANCYLQIPELRGFEQFCVGRPAEDMPNLTNRICGVCPEAHHMAATKALDALWKVDPPPPRSPGDVHSIFFATDPRPIYSAPRLLSLMRPAERTFCVIKKVGMDIAARCSMPRRPPPDQPDRRPGRPPQRACPASAAGSTRSSGRDRGPARCDRVRSH